MNTENKPYSSPEINLANAMNAFREAYTAAKDQPAEVAQKAIGTTGYDLIVVVAQEIPALLSRLNELEDVGALLLDEYEDRRTQFNDSPLWRKFEDVAAIDKARALFAPQEPETP